MSLIPTQTLRAINGYRKKGIAPGDFLLAVLRNDLIELCEVIDHANKDDRENLAQLGEIVFHMFYHLPRECWGTRQRVLDWTPDRAASYWEERKRVSRAARLPIIKKEKRMHI